MSGQAVKNEAMERAIEIAGGASPLAQVCDVTSGIISRARASGHVPPKVAARISVFLGIPLTEIIPRYFDGQATEEPENVD